MKINHSEYTISELLQMLEKKEIIINQTYQRSSGVWPQSAQTYFLDTILEGFPFPKLYFYQSLDRATRKPIKEVVDGQQRLMTIEQFVHHDFRLTSASQHYAGLKYSDLSDDKQDEFMMYTVPADVVLAADRPVLLEMFRRINAYTAPLNAAEKRHSEFQGLFKWFITDLADRYSPFLENYGVLTAKQMVRMADAELFAELAQVFDQGIVNKSNASLREIYRKYDKTFANIDLWKSRIAETFDFIAAHFSDLRETFMVKPYVFHSLFSAMSQLKFGIPNGDILGSHTINAFCHDTSRALPQLLALAEAHELQDITGPYAEYVKACLSTTTKTAQRTVRTKAIISALLS